MLAFAAVSLALAASARAAPVAASLATVEASLSTPNTTQIDAVEYYYRESFCAELASTCPLSRASLLT
jgi:hypothetical protein